jgi:N-methylhydantoinase B
MIDASGGVLDQDYEMFEQQTPHRLVKHEYLTDSAGPGQWRGGLGVETRFVIGSDGTTVVTFGDGNVEPAFGLLGGGSGCLNKIELVYPGGEVRKLESKDLVRGVPKGTLYVQHAGGGGGYGDPRQRPRERVHEEVRNGVISPAVAIKAYGTAED